MEQLAPVIYRFDAFVREEDGTVEPFSVEFHQPEVGRGGESVCRLYCPFLADRVYAIRGVDHRQACELAREFVLVRVGHFDACLVDADGEPVEMPPVGPVGG